MDYYLNELKAHSFVSKDATFNLYEEPYRYVVIDNLFKPEIYEKISKKVPELIAKQNKSHGQVGSNPNLIYDAIIYSLIENDCSEGLDFFITSFWKNYLSELFDVMLNEHTAYSAHFHKGSKDKPSKSGWAHKDLTICSAINDLSKDVKIINDCDYANDSNDPPNTNKIIRSVVTLFYLNNIENPSEEDGGGTGIYDNYQKNNLIKNILPKNNRLFIFEISPLSYHAFIGAKFDRSALVQWFHSCPSYYVHKHLDKFKKQFKNQNFIFERWKKDNFWDLEEDPEYSKYFDKPIIEILNS